MTTNIKEISKPVEQVITDEIQSVTGILGTYYMKHLLQLKGKPVVPDAQVNHATTVEAPSQERQNVHEKAIKACDGLKDVSSLQDVSSETAKSSNTLGEGQRRRGPGRS